MGTLLMTLGKYLVDRMGGKLILASVGTICVTVVFCIQPVVINLSEYITLITLIMGVGGGIRAVEYRQGKYKRPEELPQADKTSG